MAGVSVRTLRYYDEIGLLPPVWVDPSTGYRWYAPEQLRRLHRIVALRDLGVRLVEIAVLLDAEMPVEELRGILALRRAEAHDRIAAEAERLARVEARLAQLEDAEMTDYDVIVKTTGVEWVVGITETLEGLDDIGAAHARFVAPLARHPSRDRCRPHATVDRGGAWQRTDRVHGRAPVAADVRHADDGATTYELPGLNRAATTVMYGDDFDGGFRALRAWVTQAGERATGELREIYLDCDGPRDTWVVELQVAVAARK